MNATYRTLGYGVIPAGALLGGVVGETLGLRAALLVGAIGMAAAPVWVVASPIWGLHRLEDLGPPAVPERDPGPGAETVGA